MTLIFPGKTSAELKCFRVITLGLAAAVAVVSRRARADEQDGPVREEGVHG
jgi:hypothetical protein